MVLMFNNTLSFTSPLEHFKSEIIIFGIREATLNILSMQEKGYIPLEQAFGEC